jgi:DNA-binding MarR family transcriptional regulator
MVVDLEQLGRVVKQTQYRHHRGLEIALAKIGTTLAQWDALRAIDRTPGSSAHFLALQTFQSDQSFGALVSRLVAQGHVERRSGAGRKIEHYLTAEGEKMLEAGRPIAKPILEASFSALSESERQQLLDLLSRTGA